MSSLVFTGTLRRFTGLRNFTYKYVLIQYDGYNDVKNCLHPSSLISNDLAMRFKFVVWLPPKMTCARRTKTQNLGLCKLLSLPHADEYLAAPGIGDGPAIQTGVAEQVQPGVASEDSKDVRIVDNA